MELDTQSLNGLHADVIDTESSLKQFSDLLDQCFTVPQGMRYLHDFPVWDADFGVAPLIRIGVFQNQTLLATTAVRIANIKTQEDSHLRAALVGAVATRPEWRGRGLASKTVAFAIEWAKERDAQAALLWSSNSELYQRLGFEYCEQQMNIPLSKIQFPDSIVQARNQPKIYVGWHPQLFKLIQQRSGGLVLEDKDRHWFGAHRNVDWYYVGTADHPKAYAACGRGIDLKNTIHEWGGEKEGLLYLLSHLKASLPSAYLLSSPAHMEELIHTWGCEVAFGETEPLCMAKNLVADSPLTQQFWVWGLDAS